MAISAALFQGCKPATDSSAKISDTQSLKEMALKVHQKMTASPSTLKHLTNWTLMYLVIRNGTD